MFSFLSGIGHLARGLASPHLSGHAYLDPGSGSFIFQLLLAALVGAAFLIKVYWTKIKSFFGRIFRREESKQADE